jgi:tetratricopeptide (TPR) repeat protein
MKDPKHSELNFKTKAVLPLRKNHPALRRRGLRLLWGREMRPVLLLLVLVLLMPALLSCQTMAPFYFEQLVPAGVQELPAGKKLLLIDDSPSRSIEPVHKVFLNFEYQRDTILNCDSAATYLLQSLEQKLINSGHLSSVERPAPLPSTQLSSRYLYHTMDSLNSDYMLILKQYEIKTFMNTDGDYVGHNVLTAAVWELLEAPYLKSVSEFILMDTLSMGSVILRKDEPFWSLPGFEENLPELADIQAQKVFQSLVPEWRQAERYYYIAGNYLIKMAVDRMRLDDWEGAAHYWEKAYNTGNKNNRYQAAFNLALYYERQDRPAEALQWLEKAQAIPETILFCPTPTEKDMLNIWKDLLRQRQKELEKFDNPAPAKAPAADEDLPASAKPE